MSVLDRLPLVKEFRKKFFSPSGIATPWMIPTDIGTSGLFASYANTYSLFAISLRIAMTVSEVEWELFKKNPDGSKTEIFNHPILNLLNNPNPFQTGAEMMELHQLNLDISGKSFWWVPKNRLGVPGEIWVIPSNMVTPVPSKERFVEGFVLRSGSELIPLSRDEVIWYKMPDLLNPWEGVGYADAASIEIQSEDASGRWNRNFFSNSARPDGVLEYEKRLTTEDFERLRLSWNSQHQGVGRSHKVAILEGGVKWKQIQTSVKDMDFPNLRKMTRENIMFTFGIPQSVMGISENVNRANAEAGEYAFARWLIHPRLVKVRDKLNQRLVPMFDTGGVVKLGFEEVVPETIDQQRENSESGIRSGYMTINEAREASPLNLAPLTSDIGNDLLVPLNLVPTDTTKSSPAGRQKDDLVLREGQFKDALIQGDDRLERFWLEYVAKGAQTEQALIDKLRDYFEDQADFAIDQLQAGEKLGSDLFSSRDDKTLRELMEPLLTDLIVRSLQDGIVLLNPPIDRRTVKQETVAEKAAVAWLKKKLRLDAKDVNDTTKKAISKQLVVGFEKGEDIDQIATRVRGVFDSATRSRALKIARSETIAAASEGALRGYDESGVVKEVQFLTAMDERVDDECQDLDGVEFSISEASGKIPVHPNCRCTWIPVV